MNRDTGPNDTKLTENCDEQASTVPGSGQIMSFIHLLFLMCWSEVLRGDVIIIPGVEIELDIPFWPVHTRRE